MIVSHFGNYIHVNSFEVRGVVGGVLIGQLDKCKKVINNTHTCFFPCVGLKSGCFCFVFFNSNREISTCPPNHNKSFSDCLQK